MIAPYNQNYGKPKTQKTKPANAGLVMTPLLDKPYREHEELSLQVTVPVPGA